MPFFFLSAIAHPFSAHIPLTLRLWRSLYLLTARSTGHGRDRDGDHADQRLSESGSVAVGAAALEGLAAAASHHFRGRAIIEQEQIVREIARARTVRIESRQNAISVLCSH